MFFTLEIMPAPSSRTSSRSPSRRHRNHLVSSPKPDEWEKKNVLNPLTELTPFELCDGLKVAVLAIHAFWSSKRGKSLVRSERRIRLGEIIRVPPAAARNINAVVDAQFNQAVGNSERCFHENQGNRKRSSFRALRLGLEAD